MHKILFTILYLFSLCAIIASIDGDAYDALWYVVPVFLYLNIRLYIKYNDYINYQKYYVSSEPYAPKHKTYQYDGYKPYCSTSKYDESLYYPNDTDYDYGYYPETKKETVNPYDKFGEVVQLTNNIVSFKESERVSVPSVITPVETAIVETVQEEEKPKQENNWKTVINSTFLNPKRGDTTIVIESEKRLIIPQSELTSSTYVYTPKKEEYPKNAILIQNTDKITPYKSKLYNDIIYVLSTVYDNPSDFNTACLAITHIECMVNKCLVFVNMRNIKNITPFPFSEITNKIQERLGNEFDVAFESDQSVSLHEYMIITLKENKESYVGKFA